MMVVFLSFTSCGTKQNDMGETKDLYEYVANDFKQIIPIHKIDLDKESANFKYSEIFSSVKYVKLEATENSSIGEIQKLEITNDGDFIVFDMYNARIVRFDSLGNYLNNIGIKGRSKKEYVDPTDIMYDPYNEQVSVCDRGTQTIKFYNIDGTFINQIKFPKYFSHFGIISKDEIVVFRDYRTEKDINGLSYNYEIYNRRGELLSKFGAYKNRLYSIPRRGIFSIINKQLLIYERPFHKIYSIDDTGLHPLYYLDFGEQAITENMVTSVKDYRSLVHQLEKEGGLFCGAFYETPQKYVMNLILNGRKYVLYIQDKIDSSNYIAKMHGYNDMFGKFEDNHFRYCKDNKLYYIDNSSYYQTALDFIKEKPEIYSEKRGQITKEDKALLLDCALHSNPIIQICELKK